ncbi:hypothetical protein [Caballeronia sp. AZ10_KS36]|uniref:hypothetical protein n=1 Tax=Caballeronia sp. AZ10_KS36 TaxID=2921757 RepID=UPI0020291F1C|nr:hypothetical protein [Caballeronia sp. AZ10_KS36]
MKSFAALSSFHRTAITAASAAFVFTAMPAAAAIVPPGVTLAAKQELVRNNGSEVETLRRSSNRSARRIWRATSSKD